MRPRTSKDEDAICNLTDFFFQYSMSAVAGGSGREQLCCAENWEISIFFLLGNVVYLEKIKYTSRLWRT